MQIFEVITGTKVYSRRSTSGYPMRSKEGATAARLGAEAWWAEHAHKAPLQYYREPEASGDNWQRRLATRMIKSIEEAERG
ncbi:MAG: hypothetical protein O7C98_03175 [Planctomycetota bacterium]|nr:hypothetical protein [Planctomycetota bacterium]